MMDIKEQRITIRKLFDGYKDDKLAGGDVVGYGGKLNIRPAYQREFIYDDEKREAVIESVLNGHPLNAMYWAKVENGYEILDGQQRTVSICQYCANDFSMTTSGMLMHSLPEDIKKAMLDYELMVYICDGEESERLKWFEIINIAGVQLSDQELLNAVFSGAWVADAKSYFGHRGHSLEKGANLLLSKDVNRQKHLEIAIKWIVEDNKDKYNGVKHYMSTHHKELKADELWNHFKKVLAWVDSIFPTRHARMVGLNYGDYYAKYKNHKYGDPKKIETRVKELLKDSNVENKPGIFKYIITGEEKYLNLRTFSDSDKISQFEKENGICAECTDKFELKDIQADHIKPWSKGGKTVLDNLQILCSECNRKKTNKQVKASKVKEYE